VVNAVDTVVINERLPRYVLRFISRPKLHVEDYEYRDVDKIEIRKEGDTTLIQAVADSTKGIVNFKAVDVNFDGFTDLELDHNPYEMLNESNSFFLFKKNKGTFEFSDLYSRFTNVEVDEEDSLIISSINRGAKGDESKVYKVINNVPLLIKHELNSCDTIFVERLINGKMSVVEQTTFVAKQDSAGQWLREAAYESLVQGMLRIIKKELWKPIEGELTSAQRRNIPRQEDVCGSYLLQEEETYKYGRNKRGRIYRDVLHKKVIKDKLKVTKKSKEYLD
jgi:hypothetical protein